MTKMLREALCAAQQRERPLLSKIKNLLLDVLHGSCPCQPRCCPSSTTERPVSRTKHWRISMAKEGWQAVTAGRTLQREAVGRPMPARLGRPLRIDPHSMRPW